jgi:hypothetical protein
MFSDFTRGTVRRNARVGLSVGMGGQQLGGLYRSARVAPNVAATNQRRQINFQAQQPVGGMMQALSMGLGQQPQAPLPSQLRSPALPTPLGDPGNAFTTLNPAMQFGQQPGMSPGQPVPFQVDPVQAALQQIGASMMMRKRR